MRDGRGSSVADEGITADEESIQLVVMLDQLKEVLRESPIACGERRERSAEHSWHLAVSVFVLHHLAAEPIDVEHAVTLALFHDVPEIFVGDTFVYGAQASSRLAREAAAMRAFAGRAPNVTTSSIVGLWEEYEHTQSPEGRFVMALDVVLPVILNSANPLHSSWLRHQVDAQQVLARIDGVAAYSPALADHARHLVRKATDGGILAASDAEDA